jgi:predicted RNA polymerase sigma factor
VETLIDHTAIEAVYRHEAGRVLATLIRLVGDFELAEEGAQDAFEAALACWPRIGVPSNPRAWLVNTGRHKAIDRLRRRVTLRGKLKALGAEAAIADEPHVAPVFARVTRARLDVLRRIFTDLGLPDDEADARATWDHIAHSPNCSIDKARRSLGYWPRYCSLQAVGEALDWMTEHEVIDAG